MSKNIEIYKDLPEDEHTFYVDLKGNVTNTHYRGEFRCKIPRTKTHLEIDKHRAALCGDMVEYLQPSTVIMYKMLAYLRFTLKEYPSWWRESDLGGDLYDANVVEKVYDEVLTLEGEWLDKVYPDRRKGKDV